MIDESESALEESLESDEHGPFELGLASQEEAPPLPPRSEIVARARDLANAVSKRLSRPVRLSVTDNCSTMLSFRRRPDVLLLRVHHMFLSAPANVVRAIADYAGKGARGESAVIDAFVRENSEAIRAGRRRGARARLVTRGRVWDLQEIFDALNAHHFAGQIDAQIGWGRGATGRRRRTIRMGVYDHLTRTIRVHPALDRPEVPRFFVEYIVFHEMLHQAVPGTDNGRRRQHHGPAFRARERAYPDYARALAWEKENLSLLLGKPMGRLARPID